MANSGENSVSLLALEQDPRTLLYRLDPLTTINDIPRPHSVAACDPALTAQLLVTSSVDNSLTVIEVPSGAQLGVIRFDYPPGAIECDYESFNNRRAIVSLANDTLVVVDLNSLTILETIPDVPFSRYWHGIAIWGRTAWIPNQENNIITLVDLRTFQRAGEIPLESPLNVVCCHWYDRHTPYILATSYTEHGLAEFDARTGQSGPALPEVAYPIDAAISSLGIAVPKGNSILIFGPDETPNVTLDGLPGAVGITAWYRSDPVLGNDDQPVFVASSPDQDKLYLVQKVPGVPKDFVITDAAFFSNSWLAPGGLATAWGNTGLDIPLYAVATPLPQSLGGLKIRLGGTFEWMD